MRSKIIILFSLLFFACQSRDENNYELTLLPQPNKIVLGTESIDLTEGVYIKGDCINNDFFWSKMKAKGINEGNAVSVVFIKDNSILNKEGYIIKIDDNNEIVIQSRNKAGELYGIVTLSQLIKNSVVPKIIIEDEPAFKWRSFMLDEARY